MTSIAKRTCIIPIIAALLAGAVLTAPSQAEDKRIVTTTVTVGEMCGGCVKRITAHFDKIKEVEKIKCDINAKTVMLFPAKSVRLSPKKIWETMESIGKKPSKLVSPDGTYTSKPKA